MILNNGNNIFGNIGTTNYYEDTKNIKGSNVNISQEQIQEELDAVNSSSSPFIKDKLRFNEIFGNKNIIKYPSQFVNGDAVDIEIPRGAEDYENDVKSGDKRISLINKAHVIKLNGVPASDDLIISSQYADNYIPKTTVDLCQTVKGMVTYDIEDFLYCKWIGVPINRLITLRRFPVPCIDNIFTVSRKSKVGDKETNSVVNDVGDIARMVTYMTAETNKVDDILSLSYAMRWKQLTAEFDQMTMFGEQSGISGFIKNVGKIFDETTNSNYVSGRSTGGPMSSFDPKFDQNRVYGPVDSINETHIRDVGLEFSKEFEITFDYELRSINGRTPEYAMKDILANVLACTFNAGKFWPGARYWVGERPSPWAKKLQWMNSDNIDTVMKGMMSTLSTTLKEAFGSALQTLKKAVSGGFAIAMSKLLDGLGRPGIPAMQSLLSADPVGEWHLMVGNPHNPILSIGNLICTGTDIKFPTDSFGYGDFPTKMQVIVKLKPGMPKDKTQIESMFNHGTSRMYWQPIKNDALKNKTDKVPLYHTGKIINADQDSVSIARQFQSTYDFIPTNESGDALKVPKIEIAGKQVETPTAIYDTYEKKTSNNAVSDVKKNADTIPSNNKNNSRNSNQPNITPGQTTVN